MDAKIVYYDLTNEDDETYITTTSKEYWDKHHCVDDGSSDEYDELDDALTACGAESVSDSEYEIFEPIETIITKMSLAGYTLQTNTDFSAFLNQH